MKISFYVAAFYTGNNDHVDISVFERRIPKGWGNFKVEKLWRIVQISPGLYHTLERQDCLRSGCLPALYSATIGIIGYERHEFLILKLSGTMLSK